MSIPLTWPSSLTTRLPPAAKSLLEKQRAKFERDWKLVSGSFPLKDVEGRRDGPGQVIHPVDAACSREAYLYAWLLVNTRTFYFVTPKTEKLPKEDHMALQPVADLFNHTDKGGCNVTFDHDGSFSFKTTRPYEKGEEVHISYGSHSNDFLLVEYGFVLDSNMWDEVNLDDAIMPSLMSSTRRPGRKEALEEVGYWGNYVLDRETVCHRTQVAVRLLLTSCGTQNPRNASLSMEDWRRFVTGLDGKEIVQRMVDSIIATLLESYLMIVVEEVVEIEGIEFDEDKEAAGGLDEKNKTTTMTKMNQNRRDLLLKRWSQIEDLVTATITRLR